MRDAMEQLFAHSFVRPNWGTRGTAAMGVAMDVFETEQGYQVKVLLPGVKKVVLISLSRSYVCGPCAAPQEKGDADVPCVAITHTSDD